MSVDRVPFEAMQNHGQSIDHTIDKERCLGSALTIGMKIANAKFAGSNFPYWHFDANAGCGHNDIVNVPGSPVVFHVAADACLTGMRRRAFFCDRDHAALRELQSRLSPTWSASSYLLAGDNEGALLQFAECIRQSGDRPQYAIGSVIVDPNGYWFRKADGGGPPVSTLVRFAQTFERIDIILNLNLRTYWMQRSHGHRVDPPTQVLASLNKKYWLVKCTMKGNARWLLAVGRNVRTASHERLGLHQLESQEGQEIMLSAEGKRQGNLINGNGSDAL